MDTDTKGRTPQSKDTMPDKNPLSGQKTGIRPWVRTIYFRQAWQLLKQNRLYSSVYIVGTGLAIAMTMVLAIVYYIKIAPIYPETNRNRTLVAASMKVTFPEKKGMSSSAISYQFVKDHLYTLETPEVVTAVLSTWGDYFQLELPGGKGMMPVTAQYTDEKYWKVFGFSFLNGKPFTEADFQSAMKTVVISSSLANTLYGTTEAEGKHLNLDGNEYRVCGVVRDVSYATPATYAQLWLPFTLRPEQLSEQGGGWRRGLLGSMKVYMLAKTPSDMDAVSAETNAIIDKINSSQDEYVATMSGQPEPHWKSVFRQYSNNEIDWMEVIKTLGTMLLALLIVPALNLAGMVSSRMEKRLPEMGVRKAFGASRRNLLGQVLTENFLLTVLGGLFGLVLSYLLMYYGRNWIMTLFDAWPDMPPEGVNTSFSISMLFNPVVFFITLGVCFILNLISAIIPAWNGLKKEIVYSLNAFK